MPDGNVQAMQQFVGQSPWEWQPVWERLGKRMTTELEPDSAWVIDDTGFPKQGEAFRGCGTAVFRDVGQDGQLARSRSVLHHVGEQGSSGSELAIVSAGELGE